MKHDSLAEGQRWLRQADRDLDDARYAQVGGRFHLACFLAQQAAEKALKGYLYAQGAELVWGHSVAELCEDAAQHDAAFAGLKRRVSPLDKYYIPTRYPNGLPGGIPAEAFDADDARRALELAGEIVQFIQARMTGVENP